MQDVSIQQFAHLYEEESQGTITLESLAMVIANPKGRNWEAIQQVRQIGKDGDGYDRLKTSLPCFLPNVVTNGSALNDSVEGFTGLLYIDVDDVESDDVEKVKKALQGMFPSLLMCWRSVGGKGVGGILRAPHLTESSFAVLREHYDGVEVLDYPMDWSVFTQVRKVILSADPKIYINWDAEAFVVPTPASGRKKRKGAVSTTSKREHRGNVLTAPFSGRVRFSNIDEYFSDDVTPHLHFPGGVDIIQVERRWTRVSSHRNVWLFKNLVRLKHLNAGISFAHLTAIAITMNRNAMATPMKEQEVRKVATNVFRGNYIAEPNVSRKILFNPKVEKSGVERKREAITIYRKSIGTAIEQTIHDAIVNYEGQQKITAKLISSITDLSIDAVKRKWAQFKELAKDYNNQQKEAELAPHRAKRQPAVTSIYSNNIITMNMEDKKPLPLEQEAIDFLRWEFEEEVRQEEIRAKAQQFNRAA